MRMSPGRIQSACAALVVVALSVNAGATPITFNGSSGSLAASATFDTSGSNLVITLTNTSASDVLVPSQILTAVFYEVGGSLLGLNSAIGSVALTPGSAVAFGGTDPGGVVGGEFAYAEGIGGSSPNGARYGVSSAGFGIFGGATFPGTNLDPPPAIDGLNYGITSAGDNLGTGNGAVTGGTPLIKNSVTITLPGLPGGFDPSSVISNIWFQYGTAIDEGGFSPEPATVSLLAVVAMFALRRRR